MYRQNFCGECGARLSRKGWRAWLGGQRCDGCAQRAGKLAAAKPWIAVCIIGVASFGFGRYLRPAPPPLIIQRAANSPLSDLPENFGARSSGKDAAAAPLDASVKSADDVVYLCGARTQKGTPCRRRVHTSGERCYQHQGMKAIAPPEKLVVKIK